MPIPAIIGIGALIKSIFAGLILWAQKYSSVALRIIGIGILFVGVSALLIAFANEIVDQLSAIAISAPPNIQGGLSMVGNFIPSNIPQAISISISMHISGMVFQWLFYGANLKAKALIGS